MIAPTYFDEKKNTCCTELHKVACCGMIPEMGGLPIKGGCVDQYVFNSRGGCRRTKTPRRDGQENVAQGNHAGPQVRHRMAHRPGRTRRVEKATQKSIQRTGSGKLNICAGFEAATQRTAMTIGTRLTERCYQSLPHVHYNECAIRPQQVGQMTTDRTRGYHGLEVAVREDLPR